MTELNFFFLQLYTKKLLLDSSVDLKSLAASCNGYVGADLEALCREATRSALKRSSSEDFNGTELLLKLEDWECARFIVGPSITRGITVEVPKVSWDDIGGLKDLKVGSFICCPCFMYLYQCMWLIVSVNRESFSRLLSGQLNILLHSRDWE